MNQDEYAEVVREAFRFPRHAAFEWTGYDELKDCAVLRLDEGAVILVKEDEAHGAAYLYWAAETADDLIAAAKGIRKRTLVPFIPSDWLEKLHQAGFKEYAAYRDYWIDDLSPDAYGTSAYETASPEDGEEAAGVSLSCRDQSRGFVGESAQWMSRWMSGEEELDKKDCAILVERIDGRIAGIVCVALYGHGSAMGAVVWLRMIAVRPETQGKGIGRRLIRGALRYGTERGAKRAFLHADDLNAPAIGLYQSIGFRPRDGVQTDMIYNI